MTFGEASLIQDPFSAWTYPVGPQWPSAAHLRSGFLRPTKQLVVSWKASNLSWDQLAVNSSINHLTATLQKAI